MLYSPLIPYHPLHSLVAPLVPGGSGAQKDGLHPLSFILYPGTIPCVLVLNQHHEVQSQICWRSPVIKDYFSLLLFPSPVVLLHAVGNGHTLEWEL